MKTIVTISAPAGTLNTLATMDGWTSLGDGRFEVTDADWRDDVRLAVGAEVLAVEESGKDE